MKISNFQFPISNPKNGQVLLIAVMLLATVLTVSLAVTFKSTTETQLTKLEEESQKALSAAEAGIEAALKNSAGPVDIGTLGLGGGFTGTATTSITAPNEFASPLLQKDQQYTFYLANYTSSDLAAPYFNTNLNIYFASEGAGNCNTRSTPALEITLIYSASNNIQRWVVEPCTSGVTIGGTTLIAASSPTPNPKPISGFNFSYITSSVIPLNTFTDPKLLIIRTLFASTRIGFQNGAGLPIQGKVIESTAKSPTGVTKKIQLFQSYPQIPAEFFVTTF